MGEMGGRERDREREMMGESGREREGQRVGGRERDREWEREWESCDGRQDVDVTWGYVTVLKVGVILNLRT